MALPGPGPKPRAGSVTTTTIEAQKAEKGNWNQRGVNRVAAEKQLPRPGWLPVKISLGQMVVSYQGFLRVLLKPAAYIVTTMAAKKAARVFNSCDLDKTAVTLKNVIGIHNEERQLKESLVALDTLYHKAGDIQVKLDGSDSFSLLELRNSLLGK